MKKKNKILVIVTIVILVLVIIGLSLYICYDKGIIFSKSVDTIENETNSEETKDNSSADDSSKTVISTTTLTDTDVKTCAGTYSGNYVDANGNDMNLVYIYELRDDSTFTFTSGGIKNYDGKYVVNDNTVTLIHSKETSGPREQDPYYTSEDFVLADDCSYMVYIDNSGASFKMPKQ